MKKLKRFKHIRDIFSFHIEDSKVKKPNEIWFLYDLVNYFRPKNLKEKVSLEDVLDHLTLHEDHRAILSQYLVEILTEKKFGKLISEVGISQDSDFFYELKRRLSDKILPFQPEKDTLEYVLNQVFYKTSDTKWIENIPFKELEHLFDLLKFEDIFNKPSANKGTLSEILYAIGLLAQRMGGHSVASSIIEMAPEYSYLDSPFLAFEREFSSIQNALMKGEIQSIDPHSLEYKQLLILHTQCKEFVQQAYKNSTKYGITLKVNQKLLALNQQLTRVEELITLLVCQDETQKKENTIKIALKIIQYNALKSHLLDFIKDSTQIVSYEITQHTATTGEKYITESRKEYFKMLKASLGGGFIVGFMCLFKVLLSKIPASYFGYAVLYSLNYAVGFVLIYLLYFTLATKQPAMTATTLVSAIEKGLKSHGKPQEKHSAFANLFARLFRSQFIAFIGNIVMAFPVAMGLVWLIYLITGNNIVDYKSYSLLADASPVHSPAIFHAAIAGVFLFLSGIISGSISNEAKHNKLYYRIAENPYLKRVFGVKKTEKISKFLEKKYPGIVSNIWFGIFMGSTYSLGKFIGLNLDIRHITFVSGSVAMGLFGGYLQDIWLIIWAFLGIFVVGFINFAVSFSLSLLLAFRSRNIPISEVFSMNKSVWHHFKKNPSHFFFPPKNKNTSE